MYKFVHITVINLYIKWILKLTIFIVFLSNNFFITNYMDRAIRERVITLSLICRYTIMIRRNKDILSLDELDPI